MFQVHVQNFRQRSDVRDAFQQMTGRPMWVYLLAAFVAVPIVLALAVLVLVIGAVAAAVVAMIGLANHLGRRIGGAFRGQSDLSHPRDDGRRNVRVISPERGER